MRKFSICLSPDLLHLHDTTRALIVISDILRATSSMTAGIGSGVRSIYPVASVEACRKLGQKGYITAGERGGIKIPEFDLGNSPFEFMHTDLKGKSIAMTTTNGTRAISVAKAAQQVVIGSFLNLSAVSEYIGNQDFNVIILASGWQGRLSMEDTLLGGAILEKLTQNNQKYDTLEGDEVLCAIELWKNAKPNLLDFMTKVGHYRRLKAQNISRDFEFCASLDEFGVVPILRGNELVNLSDTILD